MLGVAKNWLAKGSASIILVVGIVAGAVLGHVSPATGTWLGGVLDYTLLSLVTLLFFGIRFGAISQLRTSVGFLGIALLVNFILIPLIGYGVASLFLSSHPLLLIGLVIYFMAPCTDWFLSFTRLSQGNVALGTALIPVNMMMQLLLYPVYLDLFTHNSVQVEAGVIADSLLQWFLLPFVIAMSLHVVSRWLLSKDMFETLLNKADNATVWLTAVLVLQLFASNIAVIADHLGVMMWLLLAVFIFFVLTYFMGELVSNVCKLRYPERALLTMTIASRNAPMMLAVTTAVLPDQPLIYAAIVIGMLIEIPHLTALRQVLLHRRRSLV